MKSFQNSAEALAHVDTGNDDENAKKFHGRCRLYLLLTAEFKKNSIRTA